MSKRVSISFHGRDGFKLQGYLWEPEGEAKAQLVVVHGALEHAGRYEPLANALLQQGYRVVAYDQRTHGASLADNMGLFQFASGQGWDDYPSDLAAVIEQVQQDSDLPLFVFGHSMGSSVVRACLAKFPLKVKGLVLSASPASTPALSLFARGVFKLLSLLLAERRPKWAWLLTLGRMNQPIKDANTSVDYLSTDPAVVQKYLADPLCNTLPTVGYLYQLLKGLQQTGASCQLSAPAEHVRMLMVVGEFDPIVMQSREGAPQQERRYREQGVQDITTRLYSGARHEVLNDFTREALLRDVVEWMDERL